MLEKKLFGTHLDYLQDGSHCVGFSLEDVRLLRAVMKNQSSQSGLVLIFTHAPLVNLERNPGISKGLQRVYEHNHENTPPPPPDNDVTRFLMSLEPGDFEPWPGGILPSTTLAARGYPQGGTRHFYQFPSDRSADERDELIDFGCAYGGGFEGILKLVIGTDPDLQGHFWNNVIVFSGHTHAIHEYRINRSGELGHEGPRVYAENYSGSTGFSQLPTGHRPDQLPRNQGDIAAWRRKNAPLLLISGGLKGKSEPMFREVQMTGVGLSAAVESMKMKMIPRFVPGEGEEPEEEQELDWLLTLLNVMMR
jgi:hypothetical protein